MPNEDFLWKTKTKEISAHSFIKYNKTSKQIISEEKFTNLESLRENKGTVIKKFWPR